MEIYSWKETATNSRVKINKNKKVALMLNLTHQYKFQIKFILVWVAQIQTAIIN